MSTIRAVLFDFGGVILESPFDAFTRYEVEAGLPRGFLSRMNTIDPDGNAWAQGERGEIDVVEFCARFEAEARALGHVVDARALLTGLAGQVRPIMVDAVRALRTRYRVACLTNNMRAGHGSAMSQTKAHADEVAAVMALFHHVFESSKLGARKPERRFYEHACAALGEPPEACVFLDDLGINLKPARALGMTTIKVARPEDALAELAAVLGHPVGG